MISGRYNTCMEGAVHIGIIGDFDESNATHVATNSSIQHAAEVLGRRFDVAWLPTDRPQDFGLWHALLCSPGSPYRDMTRALAGIQFARENELPFLGTCGGFQHLVLEYARNVAYGSTRATENYYCNFGLNPEYRAELENAGLKVTGVDADGEVRMMEVDGHPFCMGTLFVPQARSEPGRPHPLVMAFCRAAMER
jgi:CTP synthase (UTP-ammonia lyase)